MNRFWLFLLLSIPIAVISRRTLTRVRSHGFFRFLSWECIAWLFASNYPFWFDNYLSLHQIISWMFLIISVFLVTAGAIRMKRAGGAESSRDEKHLYSFEKTTKLIDTGIFRYIRHPLYASLLFLTWGIFLKNITAESGIVALFSSVFLYITAWYDEKECIVFFGEAYSRYMKRSKRFIPFIF